MNEPTRQSRRTLMRRTAGVTLGALAASGWDQASARQNATQNVLRVAGSSFGLGTFDPALSRDLETNFVMRQLHRGLMQFSDTLEPEPAQAETVETLDDGRRYRFTLRDDLRFGNGARVDAYAVATSLSRALNPATAGGDAALLAAPTYLSDIVGADDVLEGRLRRASGISVESDRSLVIELTEASGTFLMRLCSVPASIVDGNDVQTVDGMPVGPAGTGPFVISALEPEQALHLEPSSEWFGGDIALGGIEIGIGLGAMNPFNLFQAGELDLLPSLQHQMAPLARDPASGLDADLVTTPLFALSYIAFGNSSPPLDDIHVRRALVMAFPVSRVAGDRFQGQVEVPRGLVPQGMLGREWENAMPPFDPEGARAELARSRYGDAAEVPPIEIFAADAEVPGAFREQVGEVLGVDVHVYGVAWSDLLEGLARREYPAYSLYWGADYPDPESLLWMLFGSGSADNYTGYSNTEFDRLLRTAQGDIDAGSRADGYANAERVLLEDGACLPLYQDIGHALIRHGVHNVPVTPMGVLGLESVRMGEE